MNNYMILDGINSNTITGLIIQSLPPISKPLMRTNIETIDGKDGDIITKLGYSAYDKEISIGLSYNYNIDDVIEFFNSEGTVIFSNEPTKYYKYTILDQIDFNRLIRFKTATVRMHVQPFKYSTTEEDIEENATETDAEGVNFTLENTENGAGLLDVKLKGNTYQEQTDGANLLKIVKDSATINGITFTQNSDGSIGVKGTATANATFSSTTMQPITPSSRYTISGCPSGGSTTTYRLLLRVRNSNGTNIFTSSETGSSLTINVPADAVQILGEIIVYSGQTIDATFYPMVNAGSTALPYEPYTYGPSPNPNYPQDIDVVTGDNTITLKNSDDTETQSFTLSLGNNELCKIGDYQDYIYPANNTWYIHKEIPKVIFNGNETWTQVISSIWGTNAYLCGGFSNLKAWCNTLSDYFMDAKLTQGSILTNGQMQMAGSGIVMKNDNTTSVSDFKTWLSNNNVSLYYVAETPTDTEITDETLLSQLNALKGATTYEGQTNIITAGDLQPIIYVKTFAMDNPSYTVTNSGNYFAKPVMTIYGMGTVGIYLDGVQVLSLNLNENQTDHITIDVPNMNAYTDTINTLRNRAVTGDYNNLKFNVGDNELSFSGTIQGFIIQNYSRWL